MRQPAFILILSTILASVSCQQNIMPQSSSKIPGHGGTNGWQKVFTAGGSLGSISFGDEQLGIATDLDESLWVTTDGGQTWSKNSISRQSSRDCGRHDLVKSEISSSGLINIIGHAERGGSAIFTSSDRGKTWAINCFSDSTLNDIDSFGESLWGVGTINSVAVALHSEGRGAWQQIWRGSDQQYLTAVDFVDAKTGWAVGARGLILKTVDGGRTWNAQRAPSQENLESVNFADAEIGYAVGHNGSIFYTSDGGNTWVQQKSNIQVTLTNVVAASPNLAHAVGQKGTVLYTSDAGQHWNKQEIGTQADIYAITLKANEIWIATSDGNILRKVNQP